MVNNKQPTAPAMSRTRLLGGLKAALTLILVAVLALLALEQWRQSQRSMVDLDLVADVEKMTARLEHQLTQSRLYLANAPRDYDSYYRDVRLYYPLLLADRTVIDELMQRLAPDGWLMRRGATFAVTRQQAMVAALTELRTAWKNQRMEITDQLGDTQAEPRLEWGAEALSDGLPVMLERSRAVLAAQSQLAMREQALASVMLTVVLAVLAGLVLLELWRRWQARPVQQAVVRILPSEFAHQPWAAVEQLMRRLQRQQHAGQLVGSLLTTPEVANWPTVLLRRPPTDTYWVWCAVLEPLSPHDDDSPLSYWRVLGHGGSLAAAMQQYPLLQLDARALSHGAWQAVDDQPLLQAASQHGADAWQALLSHEGNRLLIVGSAGRSDLPLGGLEEWGQVLSAVLEGRHSAGDEIPVQSVFHELRNPLTGIQLASDGIRQSDEGQRGRWLALLERDLARVSRLLDDLRDQGSVMRLSLHPVDLGRWLSQYFARRCDQGLSPSIEVKALPSCMVMLDVERFSQVMDNLVRNAGEAHIDCTEPLSFECQLDAGWVSLELCNAGGPLPEALRRQGVQPFLSTKAQGTGLGLLISQQLLAAHGGSLLLSDSDEREGWVSVQVALPRLPAKP